MPSLKLSEVFEAILRKGKIDKFGIVVPNMTDKRHNHLNTNDFVDFVSASSTEKELKNKSSKKMDTSNVLGEILAKRAIDKKIKNVYFDRGGYKYHGRVKAFADSLRKNGLKF